MSLDASQTRTRLLKQWRDLRGMLIRQLEMFESGSLVLRTDKIDISPAAIVELKREILAFDALISDAAMEDTP